MSKEISYASGASNKPLLGDTIGNKFDAIASKYSEREAIVSVHQNIRLTYNELAKKVNTLAKALISSNFKKGDRIGIWSSNNVEWLITQYAAAKAGVILVTINPAYRSHELDYVLGQSGCKGLILQNQFKTSDYESMISEICPEIKDANPTGKVYISSLVLKVNANKNSFQAARKLNRAVTATAGIDNGSTTLVKTWN